MGRKKRPRRAPLQSFCSGISLVLIWTSDSAAKASSSAFCAGVIVLEFSFFIGSPFMRGCFTGADDVANFLPRYRVWLRPSVDNKQKHCSDPAHCLPAISVGMRIKTADGKLIVKNELRSLEAQTMIPSIGPVFLIPPSPPHAIPIAGVTTIL